MRMTGDEFAAARAKLGWTLDLLAKSLNVSPEVAAAMESGTMSIPGRVSRKLRNHLRTHIWFEEVKKVMDASGLPECDTLAAIIQESVDKTGNEVASVATKLDEHMKACAVCKERDAYEARHAPPRPNVMSIWMRAAVFYVMGPKLFADRLRIPSGESGEGRRVALMAASYFSVLNIAYAVVLAAVRIAMNGVGSLWWQQPLELVIFVPLGLFIGYFLAGTAYDLSRPIADRFSGYFIRGSLCLSAVYGAAGPPLMILQNHYTWSDWGIYVGALVVIGGLVSAMLWTIDRANGRIPKPIH